MPPGVTLVGGTVTQGSYDTATGIWTIGTLNDGASAIITFDATVDAGTLSVGQSATLTLEGTVDVGEGGNTITNITTAATGDQPDPSTAGDDLEEAVTVNDAAAVSYTHLTLPTIYSV